MRLSDWLIEAVLIIVSIVGYIHSSSFALGARMFPRFVFVLIIALSLLQLVLNMRGKQKKKNPMEGVDYRRMLSMILLIVCYALLVEPVGYVLSTPIFLFLSMWIMGQRDPRILAGVSIGITGLLFLAFRVILYVPIPLGPLFE